MRFEHRFGLLLLLAALFAACPGPRSTGTDLKLERVAPQVFRYGGIRVALQSNARPPIELRLVIQNRGSAAEFLALETAFSTAPADMVQSDFEYWRDTYFLDFSLRHGDGQSVLRLSCLPEMLQRNWEVLGGMLGRSALDTAAVSAVVERQVEIGGFYKQTPAYGMEWMMRRDLRTFPEGLGPWPGIDVEGVGIEEVQAAWQALRRKERIGLVVAGGVDAEEMGNLLFGTLSELPGDADSTARRPVPAGVASGFQSRASESLVMGMGLVMGFEEAAEAPGSVELLAEVIRLRLEEVFARDAKTRKGLQVRAFCYRMPAIFVYLEGGNVVPQAELVMSEMRKLKADWISVGEFEAARQVALARALGSYGSNRGWADELAARGFSEGADHFLHLAGIRNANSKALQKLLSANWVSTNWFLTGDDAKVDEQALLRF